MSRWRTVLLVLSLPAAVACLLAPAAPWIWPGELAVHWSRHAALALLPAMAAWRHRSWCTGALLLCFLAGLWPWLAAPVVAAPVPAPGAPTMRVVSGNLYAFSEDQSPALRAVLDRDADVVVLVECRSSRPEAHLLEDPRYPYRAIGLPRANRLADGIAVVSRWPLSAVAHNPHFGLRMLVGTPQGPVTLMVLHAPTPLTPWHWRERQRLLSVLAAEAADVSGPLVVAGDWNCTEASHDWRLVSAAGLAGPAGLRTGTWPWLLGPLGIRIDHVLVKGLSLGSASTFAIPTSDHRGVEAVVGFAPSALDRSTYRAAP